MKEIPILMKGEMVNASMRPIDPKTQTRRVMDPQPSAEFAPVVGLYHPTRIDPRDGEAFPGPITFGASDDTEDYPCPYGRPGDRLWVRETWGTTPGWDSIRPSELPISLDGSQPHCEIFYAADNPDRPDVRRWRPSIFMPRPACRLMLEVVNVRVEMIQSISVEDAIAEGLAKCTKDGKLWKYGIPDRDGLPGTDDFGWPWQDWRISPVDAYERLWDTINADRGHSWASNPWVWVIEFKRVES